MMSVPARLVKQAAKLLDAVPYNDNPTIEVLFVNSINTIEVWSMLADKEHKIAHVVYDEE